MDSIGWMMTACRDFFCFILTTVTFIRTIVTICRSVAYPGFWYAFLIRLAQKFTTRTDCLFFTIWGIKFVLLLWMSHWTTFYWNLKLHAKYFYLKKRGKTESKLTAQCWIFIGAISTITFLITLPSYRYTSVVLTLKLIRLTLSIWKKGENSEN